MLMGGGTDDDFCIGKNKCWLVYFFIAVTYETFLLTLKLSEK